jgi:hypothetical protein
MWQSLLLGAAALAVPTWQAWRWWLVLNLYRNAVLPVGMVITPEHVKALRKLRFAWHPLIEAGGPVVDPVTPYGGAQLADDLGPIAGTRDRVVLARFHIEVSAVLISVLKDCNLPAGRYRLAHLDNATMERLALREASGRLPRERTAVMRAQLPRLEPDGHFNFTVQHCRLLRKLRLEWPDGFTNSAFVEWNYPAPVVHFKRPFGDMTTFEIEMAEILDLPIPEPYRPEPLLWRLYWEMWPALQTFVEHADIRAELPPV